MTDKQFNFIMKSLKNKFLDQINCSAFWAETSSNHPNPDRRNERVVRLAFIENMIKSYFNELIDDGMSGDE